MYYLWSQPNNWFTSIDGLHFFWYIFPIEDMTWWIRSAWSSLTATKIFRNSLHHQLIDFPTVTWNLTVLLLLLEVINIQVLYDTLIYGFQRRMLYNNISYMKLRFHCTPYHLTQFQVIQVLITLVCLYYEGLDENLME